ncbi:MAG TPA: hypothetical protein VMU63_01960 [Acidimicrobiales bacterium]|nr:hypothetical protein [Acidimicrobiales bacterium]
MLTVASVTLAGCQSNEAVYHQVVGDLARTAALPKQFVWIHQTLTGTQSVSAEYEDPYRYDELYSQGGQAAWEEVVRDDAVADRFLDPQAVGNFFASSGSAGSPPTVTPGAAGPSTGSNGAPNVAASALIARHWVLDPTGAPQLPSVGSEIQAEKTDPFYASLVFLTDVEDLITAAPTPQVRQWRPNDVQPVYKPTDDPFPAPPRGVTRFDVYQQPLPLLSSSSPGATPPPPTLSNLIKVAIYVRSGRVIEIREVVDPVDQLQSLVQNYHLQLPRHLNRQGQEAFAQQVLNQLDKNSIGPPIQIGQTVWMASDLGQAQSISLPSGAVVANLSILPGRGTKSAR